MRINEYYKYSIFADLSYVEWNSTNINDLSDIIIAAEHPDNPKGPRTIVEDVFDTKGWEIKNVRENDDVGFKAAFNSRVKRDVYFGCRKFRGVDLEVHFPKHHRSLTTIGKYPIRGRHPTILGSYRDSYMAHAYKGPKNEKKGN